MTAVPFTLPVLDVARHSIPMVAHMRPNVFVYSCECYIVPGTLCMPCLRLTCAPTVHRRLSILSSTREGPYIAGVHVCCSRLARRVVVKHAVYTYNILAERALLALQLSTPRGRVGSRLHKWVTIRGQTHAAPPMRLLSKHSARYASRKVADCSQEQFFERTGLTFLRGCEGRVSLYYGTLDYSERAWLHIVGFKLRSRAETNPKRPWVVQNKV